VIKCVQYDIIDAVLMDNRIILLAQGNFRTDPVSYAYRALQVARSSSSMHLVPRRAAGDTPVVILYVPSSYLPGSSSPSERGA
jgi:hypothetical protein